MTNLQQENWKAISGYESFYHVSDLGRVKSFHKTPKVMKPNDSGKGYKYVCLHTIGKSSRKNKHIHRLVASAFIPNPHNLPQVNHKDGNKGNNNVSNLEWVSLSDNMQHAYKLGLLVSGEGNHMSKLSKSEVTEIRRLHGLGFPRPRLAHVFMVSKATIHRIIHNQLWKYEQV